MITLPTDPGFAEAIPELLDYGMILRPATGAGAIRIDRAGSRWKWSCTYPPMKAVLARTFTGRLTRAKREGLRIDVPLLVSQGSPGAPLVNGAGQSGVALNVKGLTAGYQVLEGYWLTILDFAGTRYLHQVVTSVTANGSGLATVQIDPPIRANFLDNATIQLATPQVEGLVTSSVSWPLDYNQFIVISFDIEESA